MSNAKVNKRQSNLFMSFLCFCLCLHNQANVIYDLAMLFIMVLVVCLNCQVSLKSY